MRIPRDTRCEVDFVATRHGASPLLVQVCLDTTDDGTWEREVRALETATETYPDAEALLITHDQSPPTRSLPGSLQRSLATQWLLG